MRARLMKSFGISSNMVLFSSLIIYCLSLKLVSSTINLTTTQFLNDSETIISNNARFKMGFFSPNNSTNRYLGIWYNIHDYDTNQVIWVANRNNPVNDSLGLLRLSEENNLQVLNGQHMIIWSTNVSHQANTTVVVQLRNTGNLVLLSTVSGKIVWQSFQYLTDSFLPDMSKIYWRSGPWNGNEFIGVPYLSADDLNISYNDNEAKLNVSYSSAYETILQYFKLNHEGNLVLKKWEKGSWTYLWQSQKSECDEFGKCGNFGQCNPKGSPICECLHGFEPKNEGEWKEGNWSNGCIRRRQLLCGVNGVEEDRFLRVKHMKTPVNFSVYKGIDEDDCRVKCLEKCQCVGYAVVDGGKLENGQEIAVKRLSRASGQGLQEFMNEVRVISELQHKNLVRLLGCCAERDEKLLIYELMPNNNSSHQKQLDWKKRFNIINGICRGLLYLHRDSRLKIIHRDLKASNILLDNELNPKISDFGMARIFAATQDQDMIYSGYMSPEYAMEGRFSEKSDVFSLGVLLLEIVSGRKNSSFLNYESLGLISYAWRLWNENDTLKLIDPSIFEPCFKTEIMKCIQLGLLCMQEFPEERPSVSALVSMLDNVNDISKLPIPTQPSFVQRKTFSFNKVLDDLQNHQENGSSNHASLTGFGAFTLLPIFCLCLKFISVSTNITTTQFLNDSKTIVSRNGRFKLGFFSPTNSTNRYVGIWYNITDYDTKEVVWVANRNNPLNDSLGLLKIAKDGNLQLLNDQEMIIWSSNNASNQANNNNASIARLLDNGNLVLLNGWKIVWQSFEHLSNAMLPSTTISINLSRSHGFDPNFPTIIQSWKSRSDPSNGRFKLRLIPRRIGIEFVVRKDDMIYWRSGPWNGSKFLGVPYASQDAFRILYNENRFEITYSVLSTSEVLPEYFMLNYDGNVVQRNWNDGNRSFITTWRSIVSECDVFGKCGPFGR
ncbi:hypothetical protein RDABS01_037751 [Bienertia sinuspersici]